MRVGLCCVAAYTILCFTTGRAAIDKPASPNAPSSPKVTTASQAKTDTCLLVARVVDMSVEGIKSGWIGPLCEAVVHYRVGAVSGLRAVARDSLLLWVKNYSDLSRTIADAVFLEVARKKNVPYVLFQRYEATPRSTIIYLSEVIASADNKVIVSLEREFPFSQLSAEIDAWLLSIAKALGITLSENTSRFFRIPAVGGADKEFTQLGELLQQDWYGTPCGPEPYLKIVERNRPMHLAAWLGATKAARAKKPAEAAVALDNLLLHIGSVYPALYAIACEGYRQMKRYDDALRIAALAEKAGVGTEAILVQKALAFFAKGERARAQQAFTEVLSLNSNEPQALLFLAQQSNAEKAPAKALEYAERLLLIDPKNGHAWLEKGRALLMTGRNDEALKSLTSAEQLLTADPTPYVLLGDLYAQKKQSARAADYYLRAIPGMPEDVEIRLKAARMLRECGKQREAVELLTKAEASFSRSVVLYRELGLLEYETGDSAKALGHLELYAKTDRSDAQVLQALGTLYMRAGRMEQAEAVLREALPRLDEKSKNEVRIALAKIQLPKKKYTEAASLLEAAAALKPEDAAINRLRGDAYLGMGDKSKALAFYLRARKELTTDKELQATVAQITDELGPPSAALKEYEALLKLDPTSASSYYRCAMLATQLGALSDAERYLKMGSALAKPDTTLYISLAQAYAAKAIDEKAIEYAKRCLEIQPQHVVALKLLEGLYAKRGNDTLAGEMCWRLYQIDPVGHKNYLVKAASYFERTRLDARARDAYADFLVKRKYVDTALSVRAARLEYRLKNCAQALSYLSAVEGQAALDIDVLMLRLECAAATEQHADVIATAEKIAARSPQQARAYELAALSAEKSGDLQKAISMYEKYLSLLPKAKESSDYAFRLGQLYEKRSMPQAAAARYEKNISLYPTEERNYERLSALYISAKRYTDALAVLKKALAVKETASPLLQKRAAATLATTGNVSQAVSAYQKYLTAIPDDSTALYELGVLLYELKNYPQSAEKLARASALMPRNFDCHYLLGRAYAKSGMVDKAVGALERARSIRDTDTLALAALAECYRTLKKDDELIGVLKRWLEVRQGDLQLSKELGMILFNKQRTAEALPLLETVSKSWPNDIAVRMALADIYKAQQNDALRLLHLEAVLKIDPRHFACNYALGLYYAGKKSFAKAVDHLRIAAAQQPKNGSVQYEMGKALAGLNRNEEALDRFRAAVMADPRNMEYLTRVIELAYRLGQKKEATTTVKLALELDSAAENAQIARWAGILLLEAGRPDSAKRYLQRAAAADRSCGICFHYLGDIAFAEGDNAEAVRQYSKALEVSTSDEAVLVKLGTTLLAQGKTADAERLFERTLGQNSRNDKARYYLCSIYLSTNRIEAARLLYLNRQKEGQSGWYHLLTALFEEREGNTRQALLAYAAAARALPNNRDALNGCGRMYLAHGDYETALMYLGKAAAVDTTNTEILLHMGRAYEGLGNLDAAGDLYNEVVRRDPTNEAGYEALAHLYARRNNRPKAIETLKKGLEKCRRSPSLALAIAHQYRLSNQLNDAISAYQQVERMGGTEGREACRFLGDIYYLSLKNMAKAKEYYAKYAKAGGTDQATLRRLAGL